jgi:hypothetical protein
VVAHPARGLPGGGFQTSSLECETSVTADPPPSPVSTPLTGPRQTWPRPAPAEDIRAGKRTVPDFDLAPRLTRLLDAIDAAAQRGRRQRVG